MSGDRTRFTATHNWFTALKQRARFMLKVRVHVALEPEIIATEAPVLYVRGPVHSVFLPAIVSSADAE